MLHLVDFIKNNPLDWEKRLQEEPYSLKIKRKDNVILFCYNQIRSDFREKIVKESRGIILEDKTFKVLAYPFDKFFNVQEGHADKIDWNSSKVEEKIDGSLMKIWYYKGEWRVSTMSMIDAREATLSFDSKYDSFYDLFMCIAEDKLDFSKLNKDSTYIFELISLFNKVVVTHKEPGIIHIGTRDNITLKERNEDIGIRKPKTYKFNSLSDVVKMAQELPFNEEGYIVVDSNWRCVKVKSPAYVAVHHLKGNDGINILKAIDIIKMNEHEEFLSYFPEYVDIFTEIIEKYNKFSEDILKNLKEAEKRKDLERKEFALWAMNTEYPAILFSYLDGKVEITEYKRHIRDISSEKLNKLTHTY